MNIDIKLTLNIDILAHEYGIEINDSLNVCTNDRLVCFSLTILVHPLNCKLRICFLIIFR